MTIDTRDVIFNLLKYKEYNPEIIFDDYCMHIYGRYHVKGEDYRSKMERYSYDYLAALQATLNINDLIDNFILDFKSELEKIYKKEENNEHNKIDG